METDRNTIRCEHLACVCEVAAGGAGTCSDDCAKSARDANSITCACGHEVCASANAAQLRGEGGRENPA